MPIRKKRIINKNNNARDRRNLSSGKSRKKMSSGNRKRKSKSRRDHRGGF